MARQQQQIIYIPGIQDDIYHAQSLAVTTWRLFGVRGHCHVMPWAGKQSYESKLRSLRDEVDYYKARGDSVSLIGASAGASAVVELYAEQPDELDGVILICPKINHPETVSKRTYDTNPAYRTALAMLQLSLTRLTARDKARIAIYYSPKDGVVPYEDSRMPGVREYALPSIRHGYAILYAITLGFPKLSDRLKQLKDQRV